MFDDDLIALTGLSERAVKGYEKIYPLMLTHQVAEQALDSTNGSLKKATIDIPYVGTLVYNSKKGSYTFTPDKIFNRQVRQAVQGKSSLTKAITDTLIERINRHFKDLL